MENVNIQLHDINLVSWNAIGPFRQDQSQVGMDINTSFKTHQEHPIVQVEVIVRFYYDDHKAETIVEGKIVTSFKIDGNKKDINKLDLADQAFITMLSLSISHARALITHHSKSVGLSGFVVPIVNPTDIFNKMKIKADNPA